MDWQEFRRLYPVTLKLAYLNNASMGPLPLPVRAALDSHLDRWQKEDLGGSIGIDFSERLRCKIARFISASPEEIAFTSGVTGGLFRAASLVRPAAGENIVLPANEFPSAVYPWRRYEREGAQVRFAGPPRGPVTENHLMEACDEATRAICASLVSFADGTRLDLETLSAFCRSRGIALVIDAMQAAGALKVDVSKAPVDFLAFAAVKWIPAPVGAGALYVRHGWEERTEGRWLGCAPSGGTSCGSCCATTSSRVRAPGGWMAAARRSFRMWAWRRHSICSRLSGQRGSSSASWASRGSSPSFCWRKDSRGSGRRRTRGDQGSLSES